MTLQHGTEQIVQSDPELVRKQFFAQWLAKKNPNNPLIKLGALDPNMATTKTVSIPTTTGYKVTGTGTGARRAVSEAARRVGVSESGGNNRGARIDTWQKKFGMLGQPWCGIFVGLSLEKAGVKGLNSGVASVSQIETDARAGTNGFARWLPASQARAGDALVTARGQHVGLVERVDRDGTIHTIEGNTGTGAVMRRTHKASQVYGAARPRY
jgi:hypothetical protein